MWLGQTLLERQNIFVCKNVLCSNCLCSNNTSKKYIILFLNVVCLKCNTFFSYFLIARISLYLLKLYFVFQNICTISVRLAGLKTQFHWVMLLFSYRQCGQLIQSHKGMAVTHEHMNMWIRNPLTEILNQTQIWRNKLQIDKNMEFYYMYLGSKDTCWLYKNILQNVCFIFYKIAVIPYFISFGSNNIQVFCNPCSKI
jgi:hypothetical protein